MSQTQAHTAWAQHLNACQQCRKAMRGRFAGSKMADMYMKCCVTGKRLYKDFVNEVEGTTTWPDDQTSTT